MKMLAALLSTIIKIPSLGAFVLCSIAAAMTAAFVLSTPYRSRNGNLMIFGGFLVFGASSIASFASAWRDDWQFDEPAVKFLVVWFPVLVGPLLLFNFAGFVQYIAGIGHSLADRCSCVSPAAFEKRRRQKELRSKMKMAAGGTAALIGILGTARTGPEDRQAVPQPPTLLERLKKAEGLTQTGPPAPTLQGLAKSMLKAGDGGEGPKPAHGSATAVQSTAGPDVEAPTDDEAVNAPPVVIGFKSKNKWKKVGVTAKMGVMAREADITVAADAIQSTRTCKQSLQYCVTKEAWRACCTRTTHIIRNPQELADAIKRLGHRMAACCTSAKDALRNPKRVVQTESPRCKRMADPCVAAYSSCSACCQDPARLMNRCKCLSEYGLFVYEGVKTWLLSLKSVQWMIAKVPRRPADAPPRCFTLRRLCRRLHRVCCNVVPPPAEAELNVSDHNGGAGAGDMRFLAFARDQAEQQASEAASNQATAEQMARKEKESADLAILRAANLARRAEEAAAARAAASAAEAAARMEPASAPETESTPEPVPESKQPAVQSGVQPRSEYEPEPEPEPEAFLEAIPEPEPEPQPEPEPELGLEPEPESSDQETAKLGKRRRKRKKKPAKMAW
jgi:hypothetical protein